MYCRKCKHDLQATTTGICPECSTAFDHQDPATYHSLNAGPFPKIKRFTLVCCSVPVLFCAALLGAWCCGCRALGYPPIAATDVHSFQGSLGVTLFLGTAALFGILIPVAFLGTAVSVIVHGSLAVGHEQRREELWKTLATAAGVWSGYILLVVFDPLSLMSWFFH